MKNSFLNSIRFCLYLLIGLSFSSVFAAEIHIAKDGINALTGRGAVNAPYKTINYVFNNNLVNSGDVVIIHGGFYRETLTVNVSNITIKPNGDDVVVVSGANWYGSNSWQEDTSRPGVFKLTLNKSNVETDFTQLFVDGTLQQIARFPNNTSPYQTYLYGKNKEMMNPRDQKTGFAVLLDGSKPAGTNQTAQVTFSSHSGTPIIPNVTFTNEAIVRGFIGKLRNNIFSYSQDGGQVTRAGDRLVTFKSFNTQGNIYGGTGSVTHPEGFGYIMDLSVLDSEGEWFYKKTENTLYYKPEGGTVDGKNFEIQRRKYALKVQANNVSIENIQFRVGEAELKNAQNTKLTNCVFTYMNPYHYRRTYGVYRQGLVLDNADNTTFESCYIGHTWGSGIIIEKDSDNTVINNSVIEDIGWMGQFTVAVENNGKNTEITKNSFGKASRFHIRTTESVYTKIMDNDFDSAMSMGEDAGAIMFTSTGKSDALNMQGTEIAYNKIHGLRGIPAYDPQDWSTKKYIVAFYLEDVDNYTVHHNLLYNNNDEYVSVRKKSNGTPEATRNINYFAYLGPRDRKLNRKVEYYNNTAWDYNKLIGFWHRTDNADVNNMTLKNNLFKEGLPSEVGKVSETNLDNFVAKAASEYGYHISVEKNGFITNASNHYVDVDNANFRLKPSSSYNKGGAVIPGVTTEADPAIGAWEGNTAELKNRAFSAGSELLNAPDGDNDNDGVINSEDLCPFTLSGADVDSRGCRVLENDNISIQTIGESCPDENNAKIIITASESLPYIMTFNGNEYSFTDNIEIENLEPKEYNFCITVPSLLYESCYEVVLPESVPLSGSSKVSSLGKIDFNVQGGTVPYHILVNNKEVMSTEQSSFTMDAKKGDKIQVISDKDCEGEIQKSILIDQVSVYPTLTQGKVTVTLPDSSLNKVAIGVYNMQSELLFQKEYTKSVIDLDLTGFTNGIYFVKIDYKGTTVLKVMKQ